MAERAQFTSFEEAQEGFDPCPTCSDAIRQGDMIVWQYDSEGYHEMIHQTCYVGKEYSAEDWMVQAQIDNDTGKGSLFCDAGFLEPGDTVVLGDYRVKIIRLVKNFIVEERRDPTAMSEYEVERV
jgi:phage major head subunit gpT-like protein